MSKQTVVLGVDVDGVTIERCSDRTVHHVSWSMMRQAGAPAPLGLDHPDDVAIHDIYAPLLATAREMAARAGISRRIVWEDIGEEVLDPDQTRERDESLARQRELNAEIDAARASL